MTRTWRCRRVKAGVKCGQLNLARKQRCTACGGPRPKRKQPAHRAVLADMPYEEWEAVYGPSCGICGRSATARRRLDRDHDHKTGRARGLLCARCNRALPSWVTGEWLRAAVLYLERAEAVSNSNRWRP